MYGSIIDCSKNQSKSGNLKTQPQSIMNRSCATKMRTDPLELAYLQQAWKEWKQDLKSFHLKLELQVNNTISKKEIQQKQQQSKNAQNNATSTLSSIEHADDALKYYLNEQNVYKFEENMQILNELNSRFENLVLNTEKYMKKICDFIQDYFDVLAIEQQQSQNQMSTKTNLNASSSSKPNDRLIILADLDLFEFPLESLKVFYDNQVICSLSRDFSLHFFATRFYSQKESQESQAQNKDGNKQEKGKSQDKKGQNQATLETLPGTAVLVDHSKLKYLVDPFNESSIGLPREFNLIDGMKRIQQHYSHVSAKWSGLCGSDHAPSVGECERLLQDANCFLFNGMERFLSYFDSSRIASSNLNDCKLIVANDLTQTTKSNSRLGKADVLRNPVELECENSLETSVLLSLTGVKCIISNQWSSTLVENFEKFQFILKEFIENKQSSGELIRYKISPHVKYMLDEKLKQEEERKAQLEKEKEKKEKTKQQKETNRDKSMQKSKKANESVSNLVSSKTDSNNDASFTKNNEKLSENNLLDELLEAGEEEDEGSAKKIEEQKRIEFLNNLSKLRKENLNMICYGLPEVYMTN